MTATKTTASVDLYRTLLPQTREYLREDYGMAERTFGDRTVLTVPGFDGWCDECACSECYDRNGCGCGYVMTTYEVIDLRITSPADANGEQEDVAFDTDARLCEECGEDVHFEDWRESMEAAREDAAERAWEMAREER